MKTSPEIVMYCVLNDLFKKRNLDEDQVAGLLRCKKEDLEKIFSCKNYLSPEVTGILADAFGYNRMFLLGGEDELFKDFHDGDKVYEMWKKDKLERLHSYLYRMSRCWDHPKALEIFDTYDEIQRTDSKMEILIKTQKIETLFEELLEERKQREKEEEDSK